MYCVSCEVKTEFICYVEERRPPLWSSGQSSWRQIQRSGFDTRHYQIFWETVDLERGPLSLVSTNKELLGRKKQQLRSRKTEITDVGDPPRWIRDTLYPRKLTLTSPKSCGRSVGIVLFRDSFIFCVVFIVCVALCAVFYLRAVWYFVWNVYVFLCVVFYCSATATGYKPICSSNR
jgi:hypothetical protein